MSVLRLFEERTKSQPDTVAVSFSGRRVTYAQLDERAEQIACILRGAGVGQESLVAIFLDRSPDLVAGLLGTWKAGGAYLPIDPTNPQQRVMFTLEDSRVRYVLTERALLPLLPSSDAKILCIEDLCGEFSETNSAVKSSQDARPEEAVHKQLAYVIYTSGSTGKPKGAEILHEGLLNVVKAIGGDLGVRPGDVVLATASIAFDVSNEEIFVPLIAGATVHMMERQFAGDGSKLTEMIRRTKASVVLGTPTFWRLMLEAGWKGNPNLQIITGGEVLPLSLATTLARMTKAVWNHYGPTETSICATRERVLPDAKKITIGFPIENVQIYVLNGELRQVPVGDVGEIYIGGAGVGRGYLNRPELTERTFLRDPFSGVAGTRIYKTGDLGRLLPDGRLDFQGRVDNQIKLRGFRIELEEIEAAIRDYEGVHEAFVLPVEYSPEDQRLVAYILSGAQVSIPALRNFLRDRLPFYMLPSEFIPLESLPMTSNGKIDRVALDAIRREFEEKTLAESSQQVDDLEEQLRVVWQRLLKIRNIGLSDDFFDLGGHSLLATRLFAEIEKITGKKIPLSVLVQNPTVRALAKYIHSHSEEEWPGLVPLREQGDLPPLFIAHGLGSNLLLFRSLVECLGENQPVYGIQMVGDAAARPEELTIESLAARYVDEIRAINPSGPYALAGHSLGGLMAFEVASQLRSRGAEISLLALLDCDLHVAQRIHEPVDGQKITTGDKIKLWRNKLARFAAGDMVDMVWRKLLYNKLMFKIWLLRRIHREGSYYPNVFGVDPYIGIFAEKYIPRPTQINAVVFVAEDQLAPQSIGLGWSDVVVGNLDIQLIPGTHQTMFTRPSVLILAEELLRRLNASAKSLSRRSTITKNEAQVSRIDAPLEYHQV
jgi:amino acid adenylation domain-containing protein